MSTENLQQEEPGRINAPGQRELPFSVAGDLAECLDRISRLSDSDKRDFLKLFMSSKYGRYNLDYIPRRVHS